MVFTSVLPVNLGIEPVALSEMALVMASGDLYSMVTFQDLTKTSAMQITYNWRLQYV